MIVTSEQCSSIFFSGAIETSVKFRTKLGLLSPNSIGLLYKDIISLADISIILSVTFMFIHDMIGLKSSLDKRNLFAETMIGNSEELFSLIESPSFSKFGFTKSLTSNVGSDRFPFL